MPSCVYALRIPGACKHLRDPTCFPIKTPQSSKRICSAEVQRHLSRCLPILDADLLPIQSICSRELLLLWLINASHWFMNTVPTMIPSASGRMNPLRSSQVEEALSPREPLPKGPQAWTNTPPTAERGFRGPEWGAPAAPGAAPMEGISGGPDMAWRTVAGMLEGFQGMWRARSAVTRSFKRFHTRVTHSRAQFLRGGSWDLQVDTKNEEGSAQKQGLDRLGNYGMSWTAWQGDMKPRQFLKLKKPSDDQLPILRQVA